MTDFSQLSGLRVTKERTSEYEMWELDGTPTAPEGESVTLITRCVVGNERYQGQVRDQKAAIQRKVNQERKQQGGKRRTRGQDRVFDLLRDPDREAYPGAVVIGFVEGKEPRDVNGKVIPYSDSDCRDFLRALPAWIFDNLRWWVIDPANYVDGGALDDEQQEELSEN